MRPLVFFGSALTVSWRQSSSRWSPVSPSLAGHRSGSCGLRLQRSSRRPDEPRTPGPITLQTEQSQEQHQVSGVYRCATGVLTCSAGTYIGDFAFDVLQQVFLPSDKERMLELCVISFWFYQTALLDVDHLPESICFIVKSH